MQNIALSFSGGGFRAAAYSLGCLSYLNSLKYTDGKLLENVKYISSTSGGSITNLMYSACVFNGMGFDQCYQELSAELDGDKLLTEALTILNSENAWKGRPVKSRNLINAFSMAYDRMLGQQDFSTFSTIANKPHLEEICVNATEFTNGLPFRFQSQHADGWFPKGKIGNSYIYFTTNGIPAAQALKLSDILASSSCFPSGFEPMIFPKDYANENISEEQLVGAISFTANEFTIKEDYNHFSLLPNSEFNEKCQFGIMDGGITDNQAIDAFFKADTRREENQMKPFDLFISCDVSSPYMDGYTLPVQKPRLYDFLSIRVLMFLSVAIMLWLPALLLVKKGAWAPCHFITATISGLFLLAGLWYLWCQIKKLFKKKEVPSTWSLTLGKFKWKFFSLSLGFIKQMLSSRLKSVFILSNDIYLKQIRRMYYDKLFNTEKYKNRVVQNAIYDLSRVNFPHNGQGEPMHPSPAMIAVAEKARTMGTTLWFDKNHQQDKIKEAIIATGRFTTCYNMLKYLNKKAAMGLTSDETQVRAQLLDDWGTFCKDPYHMKE